MKINEALKRIDAGWVGKPKGFRVRFNIYTAGRWDTDFSPEESAAPLDSDVTAWRLAWIYSACNWLAGGSLPLAATSQFGGFLCSTEPRLTMKRRFRGPR